MVTILYNFCAFVCEDCAHNTDEEYKHIGMLRCVCSYAIQVNWVCEEV